MKTLNLLILSLLLAACSSTPTSNPAATAENKDYFGDREGCFLLYNMKTKQFEKTIGQENCQKRQPACSTFKVPLAVMAFDSKVLKDENVVLKWDGKKDSRPEVNQDHNARTWIRDSVVWFSQRLTPKIGQKRLQKYLHDFNYGNQDMSAGITTAWLVFAKDGKPGLSISPYEQVRFMNALWNDELPVSKRAMQLTREITFIEKSPKGTLLHGKTGSNFFDDEHTKGLGWFVAHVKRGEGEYIVVTNFVDKTPATEIGYPGLRAKALTKTILADLGLW